MKKQLSSRLCAAAAVCSLSVLAAATPASANVTLDFSGFGRSSLAGSSMYTSGTGPYSESGFQLESSMFASWGDGNQNYAGSTALFAFFSGDSTVLSRETGGVFDLLSIDLSEGFAGSGASSVTFTGTRSDGSQVTNSVVLDGVFGFETHTFSGFTGLTSVEWMQGSDYHQFDNMALAFTAVPLPGALAMGMLGLGLVGWMRKHRTA